MFKGVIRTRFDNEIKPIFKIKDTDPIADNSGCSFIRQKVDDASGSDAGVLARGGARQAADKKKKKKKGGLNDPGVT